ncbi:hypothetical protein N7530_006810 [Penicillium desertorum]|uniref:Uncharacterized protein n=1 Tax=Penicillium desertorum TaxID=1303715 RepID=A0A9X0BML5_9EURO|nr:hypothetical protein N7530_006810 [Penicillium desertorum]
MVGAYYLGDKGNLSHGAKRSFDLKGAIISTGSNSFVSFSPYLNVSYELASLNRTKNTNFHNSATNFIGQLETRPMNYLEDKKPEFGSFMPNDVSIGKDNNIRMSDSDSGTLAVRTFVRFGVNIDLEVLKQTKKKTLDSTASSGKRDFDDVYNLTASAENTEENDL